MNRLITRSDVLANAAIAAAMGAVFVGLGGKPLAMTFVPAVAVSWGLILMLHRWRVELPEPAGIYPIYFGALAWQLLHFSEEWATGFNARFPVLFGAEPFSPTLFVAFNIASYTVFAASCFAAIGRGKRQVLMPMVFFIVYGALGNAISHTWWTISQNSYFPGFYTAQAYWLLGPAMMTRLSGSGKVALVTTLTLAAVLLPLLILGARH